MWFYVLRKTRPRPLLASLSLPQDLGVGRCVVFTWFCSYDRQPRHVGLDFTFLAWRVSHPRPWARLRFCVVLMVAAPARCLDERFLSSPAHPQKGHTALLILSHQLGLKKRRFC